MSVSELEQLLADLVRVPSPSGAEGPAADQAASWLSERGVAVERVGDSVVARVGGASGGPLLLLNTHLDTVGAGEGWTVDPLAGCWEGDRLVGLGANDAKGSAAAMMWATAHLAGASADLPGTLVLALNACEETTNAGMADVLAYLGESHGPPDAAVTGEPTGLEVVRAQAGLAILELSWEGRACHAAHVARVDHANALLAAARDLAALPEPWVLEGVHPLLGQSTMAVTVLQAGERHNQIPDRARAVVDARLAPPHDAAECVALLEAALPGAQVGVRSERLVPVETPADHPLVTVALECAGREGASGSSTLSDMALLAGVPAVKCGPGLTARSHAPDEFLTRTELDQGAAFYERLVPAALVALATAEVGR